MTVLSAPKAPAAPAAPVAVEAEAPSSSFSEEGSLLSALDGAIDEPEAPAEPEAPVEPDAPDTPATEHEAPAEPESDEAVFAPEALATPEGIEKAKARLLDKKREASDKYLKLKKHESSLEKRETRLKTAAENFKQDVAFVQNVRADVQALVQGDPATVLSALGRLTGKDPVKALEEINLNLLHNGRRQEVSPEVAELRAELKAIKDAQTAKERAEAARATEREQTQFIQQRYSEIQALGSDAAKFPHLAAEFAHDADATLEVVISRIVKENSDPDAPAVVDAQVLATLEEELSAFVSRRAGTATRDADTGQATRNPELPARTPGKSITPSVATQRGAAKRELTEAEHMQQLVNDPNLWASLGI